MLPFLTHRNEPRVCKCKQPRGAAPAGSVSCGSSLPGRLRIFPARPAAERPAPASRSRPCCRNSCWQLHFPLFFLYVRVCFCFFVFFFCLFKKLRVWGYHGEGRTGRSSWLLHAGGRTGQLVEEQVGVAGAHLAGGHGGDAAERAGQVSLAEGGRSDLADTPALAPSPAVFWKVSQGRRYTFWP